MKHHRKQYRSIFLSDIHIGTKRSKVEYALDFLKNQEFEYLYLVGDIIDGIAMKRNEFWSNKANDFLKEILNIAASGIKTTYLTGNHDSFLDDFCGGDFGGITLANEVLHTTKENKTYSVLHGHQFHSSLLHLILLCKKLDRFRLGIENKAIAYAEKKGLDGIICGHTHDPKIRKQNNVTYINTGDCVENLTCLVENLDGKLELVNLN
jgi:UDP-2,3-diacylglucosamine pyrophosphatase LpxH